MLTYKEKLCFWGLVAYPNLNDQQLSEKINLKRSTITSIRNKLIKNNFFKTLYVPNLSQLNCEMVSILFGSLKNQDYEDVFEKITKSSSVIYANFSKTKFFIIFAENNYSSFLSNCYNCLDILEEKNMLKHYSYVNFPLSISNVHNFLDFSNILKNLYNLEVNSDKVDFKTNKLKLTKKEKLVFKHLVANPNETDTFISQNTDVARPTISSIRKKLIQNGFLTASRIPTFTKLPFELLVLSHVKLKNNNSDWFNKNLNFLALANKRNGFSLGLYKEYKDSFDILSEQSLFKSEPNELLFSLNEPYKEKISFTELINQAFK